MENNFHNEKDLKSGMVDVRIILTDLEYIEPISKAVNNFDLSNFNVVISSLIPTNDIKIAKSAVNGADLVLIAIESSENSKNTFDLYKRELKTDYNFIEPLNLPSLEMFDDYNENNIFEDEIANSIIRGGLFSISNLSSINNARYKYFSLKEKYDSNLLNTDKLNQENIHLIDESKSLRDRNEKLTEEVKILQRDLDRIKSDFSDFRSRFESMQIKNSLEVFSLTELWNELFNEGFNENIYKFILITTDNFRPQNILVGQGAICAENREEALDWLKVIKTASILVDENINDLSFDNFNTNLNFENFNDLANYKSSLESDEFSNYKDGLVNEESSSYRSGLVNEESSSYRNGLESGEFSSYRDGLESDMGNSISGKENSFRDLNFDSDFGIEEKENDDGFIYPIHTEDSSTLKNHQESSFDQMDNNSEENLEKSNPYDDINVFNLNSLGGRKNKSKKDNDSEYDDYDDDLNLDEYNDYDDAGDDGDEDHLDEEVNSIFSNLWD